MSLSLVGALAACTAVFAAVLALTFRGDVPRVRVVHPDAEALRDAGWERSLWHWEGVRAAIFVSALALAASVGTPLLLAPVAALGPSVWARARAGAMRDRARRAFGGILASTRSAVRSGLTLREALQRAVDGADDALAARPLREALRAFDLGTSLDEALTSAALGCADERVRIAMGSLALGVAERLPRERVAELVAAVADRTAFEDRLHDEVGARAAGARQQQWILAAVVPALAVYLSFTMPALATTLASDLGRFVLIPAAAALELTGIVLARRVTRSVPR